MDSTGSNGLSKLLPRSITAKRRRKRQQESASAAAGSGGSRDSRDSSVGNFGGARRGRDATKTESLESSDSASYSPTNMAGSAADVVEEEDPSFVSSYESDPEA